MSKVKPMNKKLYDTLVYTGATKVRLSFSGGSDQDYLIVTISYRDPSLISEYISRQLEKLVENWACSAYQYDGAGLGNESGDNYVYDLVNNLVEHESWTTETITKRTTRPIDSVKLKVSD